MIDTTLVQLLQTSRLFCGVDRAVLVGLAGHASVCSLRSSELLWAFGELAVHFHIVVTGMIALRRTVFEQEPTLLALFGPGESPGLPPALRRKAYVADAFAAAPRVDVVRICAAPVLDLLTSDAVLINAVNRALLGHVRLLHQKIDVLTAGSVSSRLASFVLNLSDRFGDKNGDDHLLIPLQLPRTQIAAYIDARVETVIRTLSAWRKQGLLETTRAGIVIYRPDELRELVGEVSSDFA